MDIGDSSDLASTGSNITANLSVGKYSSIGPHCQFHSLTQHACIEHPELVSTKQLRGYPPTNSEERIIVGNDVWIGRNATLLGSITIGDGAIIGAFAVVAKDIPPYAIVVGNPAKIIRYRFTEEQIAKLLKIQWWNWSAKKMEICEQDFLNIHKFLAKHCKD